MILLIAFAFLAGIVTILSPCILPVLPIVLSGTVGGGKRKPLGIILGFILSFTFFTVALSVIVKATNISADSLRWVSITVLILFGISLITPKFQKLSEKVFSKLSFLAPKNTNSDGIVAGILTGISLGLLWTPCVGPILASVITLAASSQFSLTIIFITLAYSIGTAIPMGIIMFSGRTLFKKIPFLLNKSETIQKTFGILMILTALAIATNLDRKFQAVVLSAFPNYGTGLTQFESNASVQSELEKLQDKDKIQDQVKKSQDSVLDSQFPLAPELIPGGEWINSSELKISDLKGKVVLVDFWTYTCINCIRTLPYIEKWNEMYKDRGLVVLGVHSPEFEFEKNIKNVRQAVKDYKLTYPIVQDNDFKTWDAYNNRAWPAKYLIDKNGRIRYTHFGEGQYDETEKLIQELLNENATEKVSDKIINNNYSVSAQTPEKYLGFARQQYLASPENPKPGQKILFTSPKQIPQNQFSFEGEWTLDAEYSKPEKGSRLNLKYDAKEVFLVMRSGNQNSRVKVYIDGKPISEADSNTDVINGEISVSIDRLYKIINHSKQSQRTVTLEFLDADVEVFAFTFG